MIIHLEEWNERQNPIRDGGDRQNEAPIDESCHGYPQSQDSTSLVMGLLNPTIFIAECKL